MEFIQKHENAPNTGKDGGTAYIRAQKALNAVLELDTTKITAYPRATDSDITAEKFSPLDATEPDHQHQDIERLNQEVHVGDDESDYERELEQVLREFQAACHDIAADSGSKLHKLEQNEGVVAPTTKWHKAEFSMSFEQFDEMWPSIREQARIDPSSITLAIPTSAAKKSVFKIPVPRMSAYRWVHDLEPVSGEGNELNDSNGEDDDIHESSKGKSLTEE